MRFTSIICLIALCAPAPRLSGAQTYIISTVAGGGFATSSGGIGDGGPAIRAYMLPTGMAVDAKGNLYIADAVNNLIRKVTPSGIISSIAGDAAGRTYGYAGDGGPAAKALLNHPQAVAVDSSGRFTSPTPAISAYA